MPKSRENIPNRIASYISSKAKRASRFKFDQRNVYIFPTKAGFGFLALLVLTLVTAINYQSSLIYLLVFLLGVLFFISIWLCFLNLQGISVSTSPLKGGFPDGCAHVVVSVSHAQRNVYGLTLTAIKAFPVSRSLKAGESTDVMLPVGSKPRGMYRLEKLGLASTYPFGWVRAWSWLKLDADVLVYPAPSEAPEMSMSSSGDVSGESSVVSLDRDVLRDFRVGDTLSSVHWKKFAASGQLVVKDGAQVVPEEEWLKWEYFDGHSVERRLSFLCHEVQRRAATRAPFGLSVPGYIVYPSSGAMHLEQCLSVLAKYKSQPGGAAWLLYEDATSTGREGSEA